MEHLVLDTNAIIHIIRQNKFGKSALTWINGLSPQPAQIISVVTKAELETFSAINKNSWGQEKLEFLHRFINGVYCIDIMNTDRELLNHYTFIQAYSQNKMPDQQGNYKGGSSVNMGKNDLWIAATASLTQSTLLTMDYDFRHLEGSFLEMETLEF